MEEGGGGPRASYEWNGRPRWSWLGGRMRRLRATRWMGCTAGRCRGTVGRREREEGCGGEEWRWRDWQQLALHRASEYGADSARRPTPAFGTRLRAHTCSDVIPYLSSLCHPFLACPPVFSPLPVRSAPLLPSSKPSSPSLSLLRTCPGLWRRVAIPATITTLKLR